jgi:hypothetical protein
MCAHAHGWIIGGSVVVVDMMEVALYDYGSNRFLGHSFGVGAKQIPLLPGVWDGGRLSGIQFEVCVGSGNRRAHIVRGKVTINKML